MLKKLHTWLAWIVGVWLLLISLSGSILLYKNDILPLMYPELNVDTMQSQTTNPLQTDTQVNALSEFLYAVDSNPNIAYVILSSRGAPWHLAVDTQGTNHYFSEQGELLLTRSIKQDWLAWVRAFHMHLLLQDLGEDILGLIAIACLVLIFTGIISWWPKRFGTRIFALPSRFTHTKAYRQWHTVLGFTSFVPMFIILFTSVALLYFSAFKVVLVNGLDGYQAKAPQIQNVGLQSTNWTAILSIIKQDFPTAELRLLSLNQDQQDKVALRIKTPSEWHPNGRSTLLFDKASSALVDARLAEQMGRGETFLNTLYPVHIASVGGIYWLSILTITGLIPFILMCLGIGLWKRQRQNIK